MNYELTKDKKVLLITPDQGQLFAIPVENIKVNLESFKKQKQQYIERCDVEILKWQTYQKQFDLLSKK